jgi:hypothetical protein
MCLFNVHRRLLNIYLHRLNKTHKRKQSERIDLKEHVKIKIHAYAVGAAQPQRPIHKHL